MNATNIVSTLYFFLLYFVKWLFLPRKINTTNQIKFKLIQINSKFHNLKIRVLHDATWEAVEDLKKSLS